MELIFLNKIISLAQNEKLCALNKKQKIPPVAKKEKCRCNREDSCEKALEKVKNRTFSMPLFW
jgi:hypothetical protein